MRSMLPIPLIDFQNVTVQRGERVVLDGVTLSIAACASHPKPAPMAPQQPAQAPYTPPAEPMRPRKSR